MTQALVSPSQIHMQGEETRRQQTVARLLHAQTFASISWLPLLQEGTLVQLHIGRCRFTTRLLLEDMGVQIEDPQVRDKLARWTTLGEKRLLPEAYMKSLSRIESRARETLKEHAFSSDLGYFVPVTAYEIWRNETEDLQSQYFALRDDIIARHSELARQVVAEYEVIAADTYQRLRATHPELVTESQQQFVVTYCNRIATQIPSVERIRDSFSFRFFREESTQPLGRSSASATIAPSSVSPERQGGQANGRARARALLAQDVRQDAALRVNALLDQFLTSLVARLRNLTYDAVTDVLATMKRRQGERFSGRSTMQLNNLLAQIRELNFFGDTEMDQIMVRVQSIVELSPTERQRSLGSIEQALRAIATTTRATLLDLEEETREPRVDLGVPAIPTTQVVAAARAELRLPPLDLARVAALAPETRARRAELDGSLWQFAEQESAVRRARTL